MTVTIIKLFTGILLSISMFLLSDNSLHNFDKIKIESLIKRNTKDDSLHKIRKTDALKSQVRNAVELSGYKVPYVVIMCMLCAFMGYYLGILVFDSVIMEIALCIGSALIPMVLLHVKNSRRRLRDLDKLCSSMMLISNAYMATDDLVACIKDNIRNLEYPKPFEEFITYVTLMDSSIVSGLIRMEGMVGISWFNQWTDALILAQNDRRLKYVTLSIVDSFHDTLSAVRKSDARMHSVWQEYILTIALIVCIPAVFRLFMADAYSMMVESTAGRILLVLLILSVMYSVIRAVKINTPDIV